jgi:hypothetical protein
LPNMVKETRFYEILGVTPSHSDMETLSDHV